jgi:hypothetical protein
MRRFAHTRLVAVSALVGGAPAAYAADTSCSGTLSGSFTGNIVVPNGASCTLSDAAVTGNVQVLQNASLTIDATQQPTKDGRAKRIGLPLDPRCRHCIIG